MEKRPGEQLIGPGWWALILTVLTVMFMSATSAVFAGTFKSSVPVTLARRIGPGSFWGANAKVKMRGVQVGRVSQVGAAKDGARLTLEIDPDQLQYIPANVEAKIDVTTAFGAKFVDLVYPQRPSRTTAGRRRGTAFDQCQHRGQHGLRKRCRAAEWSTRRSSTRC